MNIRIENEKRVAFISTAEERIFVKETHQDFSCRFTDYTLLIKYFAPFAGGNSSIYSLEEPVCQSCADGILALCLNYCCPYVLYQGHLYDLTFCHGFPLYELDFVQKKLIRHIELMMESRSLVYKLHTDLVSFHTDGQLEALDQFLVTNRRRIRNCKTLEVYCHGNVEHIFTKWETFYKVRFDRIYSPNEILAFSRAMEGEQYHVNDFIYNGKPVASNLIYTDEKHRIQYDLLAPWDLAYQKLGLGIYSIIYSVKQACLNNYDYSLCYGNYPYKLDLLSPFFQRRKSGEWVIIDDANMD